MTDSNQADDIVRQLEQVRSDLHEDVKGLMHNARALTDWHYYMERYPWACLAVAGAAGFLLVPSRSSSASYDVETLLRLAKQKQVVVQTPSQQGTSSRMAGVLLGSAANMLLRGAVMSLLGQGKGLANHEKSPSRVPDAGFPA